MKDRAMQQTLLETFSRVARTTALASLLELIPYDEQVEIDLRNDRCRNISHVEGKYFVPVTDGSFSALYDYCIDHMVHPDDSNIYAQLMDPDTIARRLESADIPGALAARFRYKLQNGGWRWVEQCVISGKSQGLDAETARFYVIDIDSLVARQAGETPTWQYHIESNFDKRTGLLLERPFLQRAARAIEREADLQWCLIAIDIDHFKLFNDWFGREAGNLLLAQIGAKLAEAAEKFDGLAAYLGQDDFRLLAPFDPQAIEELYEDINDLIVEHGTAVGFSPVFGIALVEEPLSALDLMDRASTAVGDAKADFRTRICMFQDPMRDETNREYHILSDFLRGLDNDEIFFQLQPQCQISTGKIVGAEALCRWRRADGSVVPPFDFVPVLENHGFITALDRYIWEEVCAWLRSWIDDGHTPIPVSVNVSQVDFYTLDVVRHFENLVEEYQLSPSLLKIEITESAYVDSASKINDAAQRLQAKGFLVLMDDFGSGYSSLNSLSSLGVDVLKLDAKLLWAGENDDKRAVHILESVIDMAGSLDLPIISEGVETDVQKAFLERRGCQYAQGYLFYKPMNPEDLEAIIADESMIDAQGFIS